jgi:hypothetical protein
MKALLLAFFALSAVHAPPFASNVSRVTAAQLPHSWHPGCPVRPSHLRRVRVRYWGFDRSAHSGAFVANEDAVHPLVKVFSRLYAARFPIRRLRPIDAYGGKDERSLAADNTAAFNCRYVVGLGPGAGLLTRTAKRSTSTRSRTRIWKAGASTRAPAGATSAARSCDPAWRRRAASSSAVSRQSDGSGEAAGPDRRTTSTSPQPAADHS